MIFSRKNDIDTKNKTLWYSLEVDFKNLTPDEFEKIIARLYRKKGFHVTQTPPGPDNGVDLYARKGRTRMVIQAKNWKNKVTATDVLKTSGARHMFRANYAMIITSSQFTKAANEAIQRSSRIRGMANEALQRQFKRYFVIKKPIKRSKWEKLTSVLHKKQINEKTKRKTIRKRIPSVKKHGTKYRQKA